MHQRYSERSVYCSIYAQNGNPNLSVSTQALRLPAVLTVAPPVFDPNIESEEPTIYRYSSPLAALVSSP